MINNASHSYGLAQRPTPFEPQKSAAAGRELKQVGSHISSEAPVTPTAENQGKTRPVRTIEAITRTSPDVFRTQRLFSPDEARIAEPVRFNEKGLNASRVFTQIQEFSVEPALIDTFA